MQMPMNHSKSPTTMGVPSPFCHLYIELLQLPGQLSRSTKCFSTDKIPRPSSWGCCCVNSVPHDRSCGGLLTLFHTCSHMCLTACPCSVFEGSLQVCSASKFAGWVLGAITSSKHKDHSALGRLQKGTLCLCKEVFQLPCG